MRILIVEDEKPAANKLHKLLNDVVYPEPFEILQVRDSVKSTVNFLRDYGNTIDLIFMDIQLIDGLSFEVFQQAKVLVPVIFITAFDQYAIDAFRANGIDYLLKPLQKSELQKSLDKFHQLTHSRMPHVTEHQKIVSAFQQLSTKTVYKDRFLVKVGDHIRSINTNEVTLFYAEGRIVYLYLHEKGRYTIDFTLERLIELIDPKLFFRVNRSFIININAIVEVLVYSNSRLKIILDTSFDQDIIVSREKVSSFKSWFAGEFS